MHELFSLLALMHPACRAGLLYVVDVLSGFHIGIVLTKSLHSRLLLDGALVARIYTKHSTFFVDVIAAIPLPLEVSSWILCRITS